MPRPAATREQVFAAADALTEAGIRPTTILIREKVGGGSFSTVQKLLAEWDLAHAAQAQLPPLPDALQRYGLELMQKVWAAALAQDDARVEQVRAEAQRQVEEARAQQHGAEQIVEHLEGDLDEQRDRADALRAQVKELNATIDALRGRQGAAEVRALAAEAHARELEQRVATQATELDSVRAKQLEQAEQLGELAALRRQVELQAALLAQLNHKEVNA
ncbi:MAG: DNA-binding protein [Kouleothrix sp.]|jgi:chromosome segregation ATPase|nr:DNA-binding protein [Kouleothrix sp.]